MVVVEQLSAEFQIELAAELIDAVADMLGLKRDVLVVVEPMRMESLFFFEPFCSCTNVTAYHDSGANPRQTISCTEPRRGARRGLSFHAVDQRQQLFSRADVQFAVNIADVGARGVVGDEQRFGDVYRPVSQAQVLQYLAFALREGVPVR